MHSVTCNIYRDVSTGCFHVDYLIVFAYRLVGWITPNAEFLLFLFYFVSVRLLTQRETSGGIFGRTLTEWTRRRSSKREPDRRGLIGGGIRGPIMDEHGITIDYANGGGGLMNNFGMNAQAGQTAHPAVMALLEKEKKEAEAAR